MTAKKLTEPQIKLHLDILAAYGEDGLYRKSIGRGVLRFAKYNISHPEEELLDLAEAFFIANRRGEHESYFIIGRILRRAAHTLYRLFLKEKRISQINPRFLNVIR